MITLTLPNGKTLHMEKGATLGEAARAIGPGLAKAALAGEVDGRQVDLAYPIQSDAAIRLFTWEDEKGKEVFHHTTTHVMAQAILRLWPDAVLTIGPPISDGFYYDIKFKEPISVEDLPRIEAEMKKVVAGDFKPSRSEMPIGEAIAQARAQNNPFKLEILEDLQKAGETTVSFYEQGEFTDLCRGPHLPSVGIIKAFKLMSVAGSYWRGDSDRDVLVRIYGTSFPNQKELDEHLRLIEEAKKRDHRKLGKELRLFSFHEEAPGFPFFLANGTILYNLLIATIRTELKKRAYEEIKTPLILDEALWHRSGHWDHYKENMYFTKIDERDFAVKPMNCPGCLLIYNEALHSYRELPRKMAEFGQVHRHELSGVLQGLFRVRTFTQDDAHIFCLEDQLQPQIQEIIQLVFELYELFGFDNYHVELSTRPAKSLGSDEIWDKATNALQQSLDGLGVKYKINPGDGAFYGPKIDFHIQDCLKRTWQCGTIQVDFSMPERFDVGFVGDDGARHRPVMIHRAIFGSIERFLGILIEHWAGDFPLWFAPIQAIVLPISSDQKEYAHKIRQQLDANGIRAEIDESDEKIGKKIREAEMRRIPIMLVAGKKEMETEQVAIRRRHIGDLGAMPLDQLLPFLCEEIEMRSKTPLKALGGK